MPRTTRNTNVKAKRKTAKSTTPTKDTNVMVNATVKRKKTKWS